jgi:transcriptional regulator with XRE-family HTH domain
VSKNNERANIENSSAYEKRKYENNHFFLKIGATRMVNFGATIKKYREQLGHTQSALASRLDIEPTYLSAVENNHKAPSIALIKKICKALGIPEEILFWESVHIEDGLTVEDRKAIEIAKVIVKSYYGALAPSRVRLKPKIHPPL